jgi:4-hydroxyphenylacetate 3-monooxygenase
VRTGAEYLRSIKADGRTVYVHGQPVDDVTEHPAFHGIAHSIAAMYDAVGGDPAMVVESPETGGPINRVYAIPRSVEDLRLRRETITKWSQLSQGFVGRGPDHVAAFMAGFGAAPEVFGDTHGAAANVARWYRRAAAESAYATYTIIPPQVDRSTTAGAWKDDFLQVGVVEERDGGIVVRGSQMLGTATAVSDHLFVSCIKPLQPGDEVYANSFMVPVATPGLKVYCRRPYATAEASRFDYPLSSRFDETDALIVFDDVFVPWEDVFVYRDIELVRRQWFETAAHALGNSQAQIRLVAKTKFLAGIARKIAAVNGIERIPSVQEKLGELASVAAVVEGMVLAAEAAAEVDAHGVARPHPRFLYGAMGLQSELYPRILAILRELAGGGVIQLPSSYHDLVSEETRPDIDRYFSGAHTDAEERIKLFKLAWDAVGSEFGGRHHQYEMFYAGAPFVTRGYAFRNYGYEEAVGQVENFLSTYSVASTVEDAAAAEVRR